LAKARPDLVVMGAGIFGLSVAAEATRRGARVQVIERTAIGAGASGGVVGALTPFAAEPWDALKDLQQRGLRAAPAFWSGIAGRSGQDPGFAVTGRVEPVDDPRQLHRAEARAAAFCAAWGDPDAAAVVPVSEMPAPPHSGSGFLYRDRVSARLDPRRSLQALAGALRAGGGEVLTGDAPPDGHAAILWATGVDGLRAMSSEGDRIAVKGQAARLRPVRPPLAPDSVPVITGGGLYLVAHRDGSIAVGSTSAPDFARADARTDAPDAAPDAALDALIARATTLWPVLAGATVIERWEALRPRGPGGRPLLGPWPSRPGQFIANGGFKIGFGLAPEVARLMADLILDGRDDIPAVFRP
jgi:glycine oxidase